LVHVDDDEVSEAEVSEVSVDEDVSEVSVDDVTEVDVSVVEDVSVDDVSELDVSEVDVSVDEDVSEGVVDVSEVEVSVVEDVSEAEISLEEAEELELRRVDSLVEADIELRDDVDDVDDADEAGADEDALTRLLDALSLRVDPDRDELASVWLDSLDPLDPPLLVEAVSDVADVDRVGELDVDAADEDACLEVATAEDDVAPDEPDVLASFETSAPASALPEPPEVPQPAHTIASMATATRSAIVVRSITTSPRFTGSTVASARPRRMSREVTQKDDARAGGTARTRGPPGSGDATDLDRGMGDRRGHDPATSTCPHHPFLSLALPASWRSLCTADPRGLSSACAVLLCMPERASMATGLEHLLAEGVITEVLARLQSGKEAEVYVVRFGGRVVAAKVYKDRAQRSFKNNALYKEGRTVRNTRSQRAMNRGSSFGKAAAEDAWKTAEADALYKLHAAEVRVPTPVLYLDGVLLMELVLGPGGDPARRLIDTDLTPADARAAYHDMVGQLVRILSCDLIHGDLSPYNVLWGGSGPTIIDFPQIVSASHNSSSEHFFLRDADNILGHFARIDRSLQARYGDPREIWAAYRRRELTPDFRPTGQSRAHHGSNGARPAREAARPHGPPPQTAHGGAPRRAQPFASGPRRVHVPEVIVRHSGPQQGRAEPLDARHPAPAASAPRAHATPVEPRPPHPARTEASADDPSRAHAPSHRRRRRRR
jgi:RIO kinase 1